MHRIDLKPVGEDLQVYCDGRPLYASDGPQAGAIRRAAARRIGARSLIIVPSPLLCYGLDTLLERCGAGSTVLCVEFEPRLAELTRVQVPQGMWASPNVIWLLTPDDAEIDAMLDRVTEGQIRRALLAPLSGGYALHRLRYLSLLRSAERSIRVAWQNRATLMDMGRLWIRNMLANLPLLSTGGDCGSLHSDRVMMVVGAGESIEGCLPLMRRQRTRLCLVAVDTALPTLRAVGLVPDAVVSLDAQQYNLIDFLPPSFDGAASGAEFGIFPADTVLLCDICSCPDIVRSAPTERRWFFSSRIAHLSLLDRLAAIGLLPTTIPPLGSVGVAAVWLALRMSRAPLLLCGLDFCYRIGKTHARGSPPLTHFRLRANRLNPDPGALFCLRRPSIRAKDKHGATCRSELLLLAGAELLQSMLAGEGRAIDIGAIGLPIGAAPMVDDEAIERLIVGYPVGDSGAPALYCDGAVASTPVHRANATRRCAQAIRDDLHAVVDAEASGVGLMERLSAIDWLMVACGGAPPAHGDPPPGVVMQRRLARAAGRYARLLERLILD